jgi:hypothetical protein
MERLQNYLVTQSNGYENGMSNMKMAEQYNELVAHRSIRMIG